jgi:hypothetical protein
MNWEEVLVGKQGNDEYNYGCGEYYPDKHDKIVSILTSIVKEELTIEAIENYSC